MKGSLLKRSLLALALILPTVAWADFQAGLDAYNRGDFAEAYKQFLPLAEQGDAVAQLNLGFMYENGRGVPQDYGEAIRWYRQAAAQGYASAQYNLGLMYAYGIGVPQDDVRAYAWFNLAAGSRPQRCPRSSLPEMSPHRAIQRAVFGWVPARSRVAGSVSR